MRNLGILALGALLSLSLSGCAADANDEATATGDEALTSSAPRPFDLREMTAKAARTFATPTGKTEICVITKPFTADGEATGYTEKDAKREAKLCKVDLNAAPGTDGVIAAGLAPKANSTNPATDVHEVTAEIPRSVVESTAEANSRDRKAKKLGRIKSSLDDRFDRTSTYAPSIMGYYATSRMLGNIGEVTPAVWRTLDVQRHVKVAQVGSGLTVPGSQIVKKLWATFVATDNASQKTQLFYTTDGSQLYGAFIPNVSGDEKDKTIDTLGGIQSSAQYKRLTNGAPIAQFVPSDFKSSVEQIVPMQGLTEMLVLDAIMLQGDRLSGDNVSYVPYVFWPQGDGTLGSMSKDDFDDLPKEGKAQPANAVTVRKLYLNDVDAGLIVKSTENMQAGQEYALLKSLRHVSPDLYACLQKLAQNTKNPAFTSWLVSELRFTDRDVLRYTTMAQSVASLFKDRCEAGSLVLDLDVPKHVAHANLAPKQGCE